MKHGFIKVAAVTPDIRVADIDHNKNEICKRIDELEADGAKVIVFPELCLTGYTCGDLFFQDVLLKKSREALKEIVRYTRGMDALVFLGLPYVVNNKLYNVAAAIKNGKLLGLTSKTYLPNYCEFYEMRQFQPGPKKVSFIRFDGEQVPFGPQILFECEDIPNLVIAAEICEDVWAPNPPSVEAAISGATLIVNCSASDETVGKADYRESLIGGQSARLICGYVYANAGEGESTTDVVFGGHNIIAENGSFLAESKRFKNGAVVTEIDIDRLVAERRKNTTFQMNENDDKIRVKFSFNIEETELTRYFDPRPFVPGNMLEREKRCEEILMIQAMGLKKRLVHTHCKNVVIGISGGLDSTLALLVAAKAFDLCGLDRKGIWAVTMPCFGTTDRTYNNACLLTEKIGASLMEINIKDAVRQHFQDIGHEEEMHDVTYENCQARERTQVLMDIANKKGGMVVGTGDMSELALGWATYNGDHMSMYGVNAGVPKTLVRHLVQYYADTCEEKSQDVDVRGENKSSADTRAEHELKNVLYDILDTPVSPELLPPKDGEIAQKTEDLVGPYELHDFYLYYVLRFGYEPEKILRIAKKAFDGMYDEDTIEQWLQTFYRRFFAQQFKRSCLPDGPKVGSVAVSPRGDLRMPSDACAAVWMEE